MPCSEEAGFPNNERNLEPLEPRPYTSQYWRRFTCHEFLEMAILFLDLNLVSHKWRWREAFDQLSINNAGIFRI